MNKTELINIKSMNGYTKTDFGCYTFDLNRPMYYEANALYITEITKNIVDTLENKNFQKVYSKINIFDQLGIKCSEVELYEMVKVKNIEGLEVESNYKIEQLNQDNLKYYSKYEEAIQVNTYDYYYNTVDESFLEKTIFIIKDNSKIIGSFEVINNSVIENVFLLPEYRNKGIMKYFINLVSDLNYSLICEEDVIRFYEKCGFRMNEKIVKYAIDYNEEFKEELINYINNNL